MINLQHSYCGPPPGPATWASQWNGDPVLVGLLAVAAIVIWMRLPGMRRQAGLAAVAVLAIAFVSPLCGLTTALFTARAVHHVMLVAIAAPLLAVAIPIPIQRGIGVTTALIVSTAMLWAWHVPFLYDAALSHVGLYWAMQVGLIASAWAFWSGVRRAAPVDATMGLVGGAVQMGFLGALLTFATRPLYSVHLATTAPFGIGPLADQRYAGLVMWVPGMLPYAFAVAWLAHDRWRTMARAGVSA